MLHLETITPETLALIRELQEDEIMKGFNLVGGTTLALLIGHRMSEDIDLFSESPFDSSKLAEHLKDKYKAENIRTLKNAVFCFIRDVKVDILTHQYPLINPVINEGGIRMVSLEDIGAMKLNVITDSGRRLKDFIDMYSLLEHRSLRDFFDFYETKYPDVSRKIAEKALNFHSDIKETTIHFIHTPITQEQMAKRLYAATIDPTKIFKGQYQKEHAKKLVRKKSRRRKL